MMKIKNRTQSETKHTITERLVLFVAVIWTVATGWLFLCSAVADPPLPPPQVIRFMMDVRMFSLPGWTLAMVPLWSLWLDYQAYGKLPALTGWLRRYGFIVAASLGTAFWMFSQRGHPDVVDEGACFPYILLWAFLCMLCIFRRPIE